jgi:dipeptidyl-peptidase-4
MIVFVKENNLYLKKIDFGTEITITTDGKMGEIWNGTPDSTYKSNFSCDKMLEWSPDSKMLAFVRLENGEASVCVYDVFYKSIKQMDIKNVLNGFIPRILWTQTAENLAIIYLNHPQHQLNLLLANPKSTVCTQILTENTEQKIDTNNIFAITFLPNNQFVFLSKKNGFNHIYLYSNNGILKKQLTKGKWNVTKLIGYDDKKKIIYYQSSETTTTNENIQAIDLKENKIRINNDRIFNPDKNISPSK